MKISIETRKADKRGRRSLRLVWYGGSYVDPETKKRKKKRHYEPLDYYVYAKPRTPAERQHNNETYRKAEAISVKRLHDYLTGKYCLAVDHEKEDSFYEFYEKLTNEKIFGSKSNYSIWVSALKHLKKYHRQPELTFGEIDANFLEGFRHYLMYEAKTKSENPLSQNTQSSYFNKIRACINNAHDNGIIQSNPNRRVQGIKERKTKRTYLTEDELEALAQTECRYDVLKRAFLFGCCTGLRWSDINKLTWENVESFFGNSRIIFSQQKTHGLQYLDLNTMAVKLMGERKDRTERVFKGLKYSAYHNIELLRWAMRAGIDKHVTFHTSRHTFAVIQINRGVSIYDLSKLLGHSEVRTTERYADITESKRREAMLSFPNVLSLNPRFDS
ncbi:site-specific integrase [Oceanimonas smirnovii]|uniref:site-specific integrase n=1 Tax=Oceanimonas smirnovii TaxID=264574 RepID=UPI003AAFF343